MTRLEVMGILVSLVVCVGLFAWVFWSNLIAREKMPPRIIFTEAGTHVELYGLDPGRINLTRAGLDALAQFGSSGDESWTVLGLSPLTGRIRRLHIWAPPGESFDFDWSTIAPAPRLFDQFNPRPWAHG